MGPPSVSKANVKYPIFAASFAHNNPAVLIVGGGGGAGRSGVTNALCAFDTSSRAPTLEPFADIVLSRDEDSVTCIAPVSTKEGCILYAGVNSSKEERLKGQNAHFRAYDLTYPQKKANSTTDEKPQGKIEPLSQTQLFSASSEAGRKDGYQRLVRLSPPGAKSGGKRIGVVASSLQGNENELIIFPAVSTKPEPSDVIQRVALKEKEVNDADILETEDRHFQVAYCTDSSVHVQRFTYDFDQKKTGKKLQTPVRSYEVPFPDVFEKKGRPKLRAIRWLSPSHILLLVNRPNRTGVELQVLRLYSEDGIGSIILRKVLGKGAKQAIDMDTVRLDADRRGAYQIAIAVATQDVSLHLFTIDYNGSSVGGFAQYAVYQNVHDVQMTKVVWSPFLETSETRGTSAPLLRLASTSLSGSISVDTFEPYKSGSKFVLSSALNRRLYGAAIYAAVAFIVLMLAVMTQSLVDPQGNWTKGIVPSYLQNAASNHKAPGAWMEEARKAGAVMNNAVPAPVAKTTHRIRDLLHLHRHDKHEDAPQKALVIHADPDAESSLSTEVHDSTDDVVKRHTEARKWEELSHAERKQWKEKLAGAGMWAVEEGETILKSIFFSQAAGLVGHVAQGVLI